MILSRNFGDAALNNSDVTYAKLKDANEILGKGINPSDLEGVTEFDYAKAMDADQFEEGTIPGMTQERFDAIKAMDADQFEEGTIPGVTQEDLML